MYVCMYVCILRYICIHIYIYISRSKSIFISKSTHIYMYIHTYIHTYIHVNVHINIDGPLWASPWQQHRFPTPKRNLQNKRLDEGACPPFIHANEALKHLKLSHMTLHTSIMSLSSSNVLRPGWPIARDRLTSLALR